MRGASFNVARVEPIDGQWTKEETRIRDFKREGGSKGSAPAQGPHCGLGAASKQQFEVATQTSRTHLVTKRLYVLRVTANNRRQPLEKMYFHGFLTLPYLEKQAKSE